MGLVALSALVSMLPLLVWWRQFAVLFFFQDDWELLQGAANNDLIQWLFQPFLGEGVLPLFKLLWIVAVRASGGSYLFLMVLLWATHFAILLTFGWLLLRFHLSATAAAIAILTLGLPWTNLETLGWSMQWSALLAILFLLLAWHLLLGIQDERRWMFWYVLCLSATGLVSTRGVFYGGVLAAFILASPMVRKKWPLTIWSLLPSVIITIATLLAKGSGFVGLGATLSSEASFAAHDLLLNPLYLLFSYPGRHVGLLALAMFGAAKAAVIAWAIINTRGTPLRVLLLTLLAFDLLNAAALGYGRAYTGILATVSARYQYVSLLCFGPAFGYAFSRLRKEAAVVLLLLWLGLIAYPWRTHIGVWSRWRGTDLRIALQTGAPDAHFDPSSLTVSTARQLMERYGLH
jgi:hypothetical protein